LVLPPNLVLQCPGNTSTNVTGIPRALAGCGSVNLIYSDVVSNGCGMTRTIQRLWTATDQCGNTTNGLQTIAVVDTNKPIVTCPNPSYQCAGDVPPPYPDLTSFLAAGGTASDSCSPTLAFALISDSGLIGKCPGKESRVYQLTDVCGNFAQVTQTITVQDTIPPVITCPTNASVECGVALVPANTGLPTATDNCSTNVSLSYADAVVPSCYNLGFYAADPSATPTYLRLSPASLPCPASALSTGRAPDPLRNAVAYGPTASQFDGLTSLAGETMSLGQIVPFEVVINVCGGVGPEQGTIDFSASWATYTTSNNRFGYDTNYMVYCAFVDTADAGYFDPQNSARVVSYKSTLLNPGTINEEILGTFTVGGLQPGARVIVEIWLVLDSSMPDHTGGTVAAQMVSAQADYVPPVSISTTGSKTISVGNLSKITPLPPPQPQPPAIPPTPQPPAPPGLIVNLLNRTWTATDDCGNRSTCVQQITVRDSTPPLLSIPADIVLECPADTSTNNTGTATASDACGSASITYSDSVSNGCGGTRVVSRIWTATDDSGNITNAVQTITVRDTTPPTLTINPSRTVAAGEAWTFDDPVAFDSCSAVTVNVLNTTTNLTATNTLVATQTWEATDACGNTSTCQQTVTQPIVLPLLAPTIVSAPKCQTVGCGNTMTLSATASGTPPFTYQWQFDGRNIAGATNSLLNLSCLQFTNAGLYSLVVSNAGGTTVSPAAVVNVASVLTISRGSNGLTLTWPSPFILQSAPNPLGPYTDVAGATSPYTPNTRTVAQSYFRLRSVPFAPALSYPHGAQPTLSITGIPGFNFVIQASTNLTDWVNLQTNTAPCTFVDSNAWQYPMRLYRVVPALAAH
jgi:hypothetical protein